LRDVNGGDFYGTVQDYLGSDVKASEFLNNLGYTGVKVQTGATKGGDGRGMNYVIFDTNDAKIVGHEKFSVRASQPIEERLSDDRLLNAQDLISDVKNVGGEVDEYGNITVYHRTKSKAMADAFRKDGVMQAKEDGLFFSTNPNGSNNYGYGDEIVKLHIPAENLVIDDVFGDELSLRMPLGRNRMANVSGYLDSNGSQVGDVKYSADRKKHLVDMTDVELDEQKNLWNTAIQEVEMLRRANAPERNDIPKVYGESYILLLIPPNFFREI